MKSVATEFLDMFLEKCAPGRHEFTVTFGDERRPKRSALTRSATEWPFLFMKESFPQFWRMVEAWLVGREAFLTVRTLLDEHRELYPVEEIRCWTLTPLGAVPYDAVGASEASCMAGDTTVWNMDRNREERFCDAWETDLSFPVGI